MRLVGQLAIFFIGWRWTQWAGFSVPFTHAAPAAIPVYSSASAQARHSATIGQPAQILTSGSAAAQALDWEPAAECSCSWRFHTLP